MIDLREILDLLEQAEDQLDFKLMPLDKAIEILHKEIHSHD